jgi:uncharacterized membrane protein YbhN (UPF0104 family)
VRFKKHARLLAFIVLAAVTACGAWQFATGDWASALTYWRGKMPYLAAGLGFAAAAAVFNGAGWMWLCGLFGIRAWDATGAAVFLSAHAGQLLPVHLGNLIRPDAIVRLGRGVLGDCLKVEAVLIYLDAAAAMVVVAGFGACLFHPMAGIGAAVLTTVVLIFVADRAASLLAGSRVALPVGFWRRWEIPVLLLLEVVGWLLNGLALYIVVKDLPGRIGLPEALFVSPFSAGLAMGTGLPGGIGAIEGILGVSLKTLAVPGSHLALAVGAYRLVQFWIWLPIGWVALALVNRASGP